VPSSTAAGGPPEGGELPLTGFAAGALAAAGGALAAVGAVIRRAVRRL
jgi:LPXTG-motif cell wall-anchored protein